MHTISTSMMQLYIFTHQNVLTEHELSLIQLISGKQKPTAQYIEVILNAWACSATLLSKLVSLDVS